MSSMVWLIEEKSLKDLRKNPKNPRRINENKGQKLKESIIKFGVCDPLIIQPDGLIIGGHQRYEVLRSLDIPTVLCAVPSRALLPLEVDQLCIMLNKVQGEFDFDKLANEFDEFLLINSGFLPDELCIHTEKEEQSPKNFAINIKFENEEDLRLVEKEISPVLETILTAKMKVKIK